MKLMAISLTILIIFILLVINEWWWRSRKIHDEFSRKFVHITVGSFVAFWPYFLSWNEIRILSLMFLVVVGISKYFKVFKAIHSVTRPTWGEVYFALAVGLVTFVTHRPVIYAAALLQMSLADGLAAIIGTKYGAGTSYKVFGNRKSLVGSACFLLVSYIIVLSVSVFTLHIAIPWCLIIATSAAVLENIGFKGLDNLLVPLFVAAALRLLA